MNQHQKAIEHLRDFFTQDGLLPFITDESMQRPRRANSLHLVDETEVSVKLENVYNSDSNKLPHFIRPTLPQIACSNANLLEYFTFF